ncbi:sensor domain-containing diguanylate cyclase [Jeotgalibacillus sp. R-1-5s-1]|uniref:sensor domain-containing diguanylate cyclase n=1 Tax=Jeotgalibacillus sp. R-1-5s-1 TaxID=2555897 RepID=UPI001069B882|nr:sensor domain-containing diguanylate cyclase [Jeotgalibacillus sp. R-1-5s-1]TFD96608.1 sensor domain-containing diguanylate cyclase [Jeotgalibacillus sp. R-1-5s-1]
MRDLLLYMIVYLVPAGILLYMAADIFWRNTRRIEHRLLSAYITCYAILFLSEFVRQQVDISYSPMIITYVFGNAGLLILCFSMHFIFKVTPLHQKVPSLFYPWIFYLPAIPVVLSFVFQSNFTNSTTFEQNGLFIYPEFNAAYLTTLTFGNIFHIIIIFLLLTVQRKSKVDVQKRIFRLLILIASIVLVWDIVFGYIDFRGTIPPYPYIYGGMIWAIALSVGMRKFDFLASYTKRFSTLYNLNPDAIILIDEHFEVESANPAAKKLMGIQRVKNTTLPCYIPDKRKHEALQRFTQAFETGTRFTDFETKIANAEGNEKYVIIDGDFIYLNQKIYLMLIIRDVHSFKEAEQTIRFLAYHDPLTKLANRRSFYERSDKELGLNEQRAFLILDLDGFKGVNDTYGHQVGDDFLVHVGRLFESVVGEKGLAARVGGDEFYAFLAYQNDEDLHHQLRLMRRVFNEEPLELGGEFLPIRFSLGVSRFPEDAQDVETLIHKADQAMYSVKNAEKNNYALWEDPAKRRVQT